VTKNGDAWVETDTRDGKTVSVTTFTVVDGKLHVVSEDPRDGSKTTYDATRS
jgi:dTDP-4-dehydrorhamnose 3,5-epimerase-like enzyme